MTQEKKTKQAGYKQVEDDFTFDKKKIKKRVYKTQDGHRLKY